MANTINFFCANDQADTEHALDIDTNGEIVLTCPCGRFVKFPKGTDSAALKAFAEAHKAANMGQLSQEKLEAEKAKLLADLGGGV